jgi:hypothetical protein
MSADISSGGVPGARKPRCASDRLEQALRLYRRRIGRCRGENQQNRVHIALENYMTPAEVRYFGTALAGEAAESASRRWISRLGRWLPVNKARPVEFERRGLLKGATLYAAGDGHAEQKSLIIGLTGHFHRLMLPMPWLLDCLNPALYDFVVLRDFSRLYYALGIPGLGSDFVSALSGLRSRIDPRSYRNAIALGTSGGGLPALMAAMFLELDKGIAIGPQDLAHVAAKLEAGGLRSDSYAALLASRPRRFPELAVAFGADHTTDAAAAAAIHALVPSTLRPVRQCAQHAVFDWHLRRGTLPHYLSKLLGQSLESRDLMTVSLPGTLATSPGP